MNKIELIEDLIESSKKISYLNKKDFDELERRAKMIIIKIFGKDSHYIQDLDKIRYSYEGVWISGMKIDYAKYFEKGLKQFKSVLNVMLEDVNLSTNYNGTIGKPKKKVEATGAGSANPVVSIRIESNSERCCNLSRVSIKSPRTVQHKHPLLNSTNSS